MLSESCHNGVLVTGASLVMLFVVSNQQEVNDCSESSADGRRRESDCYRARNTFVGDSILDWPCTLEFMQGCLIYCYYNIKTRDYRCDDNNKCVCTPPTTTKAPAGPPTTPDPKALRVKVCYVQWLGLCKKYCLYRHLSKRYHCSTNNECICR